MHHLPLGTRPWAHISAENARARIRSRLTELQVPQASRYGTHDFRRGHAKDMAESGSTLAQILRAGQWRSAAFMRYMEEASLSRQAAVDIAIDSDGEDWID